MDPLIKAKLVAEGLGAIGVSALALSMTTEEIGIAVTIGMAAGSIIVALSRLTERVAQLVKRIDRMDERVGKIADHVGVVE